MKYPVLMLLAALISGSCVAEVAVPPVVDISPLPTLGSEWRKTNPFRELPVAVDIGRSAFNQSCARCHGTDANPSGAPAPDLRQLERGCRRIGDAEIKARCMADNDTYFSKSVREGKIIVGVTHMPPWKSVLSQEIVWSIQAFIESRRPGL